MTDPPDPDITDHTDRIADLLEPEIRAALLAMIDEGRA